MILTMLKPIFKRFKGLFISMAFVSMLSIGLLVAFASAVSNLKVTYESYIAKSEDVDAQVTMNYTFRSYFNDLYEHYQDDDPGQIHYDGLPSIKTIDFRYSQDMYLIKNTGRTITCRIYSYTENDKLFSRRVIASKPKDPTDESIKDAYCVSVISKFANNNKFKTGDTFKIGFYGIYITCYISEIVETPEGIYPRTNDYIWSDNQDFGYLYVEELELNNALLDLGSRIQQKVREDETFLPDYREYFEEFDEMTGGKDLSELIGDGNNYAHFFANQMLIKANKGYSQKQVIDDVQTYVNNQFSDEETLLRPKIKSALRRDQLPYEVYMQNALKQLTVATTFLPVFFYTVTMIVIGLFMNQIIKTMTPEIGVLMSIGVDKKQIATIYLIFTGLMALVAGIVGITVGYGLDCLLTSVLIKTYSMSMLGPALNPLICVLGVLALFIFALLATFLSCLNIFKITPKDATISNESKRRNLPRWLDKLINKSTTNMKLAINSIAQNPRRFLVSSFAIFASYVLILLSSNFYVAKNEMISQTVNRRLSYDCQIYMANKDESIKDKFDSDEFKDAIDRYELCCYTYTQVSMTADASAKNKYYIECLSLPAHTSLVKIPDSSGRGTIRIPDTGIEGVILPTTAVDKLGKNNVKVGGYVYINGHQVKVSGISYQYFHPVAYFSEAVFKEATEDKYVTSVLVDVKNENLFLEKLASSETQCLTVFTSSLSKDLVGIFNAVDIFIIIMIIFSLGMAFIILFIMAQNALLETKRQVSVFRAIGFTIGNISNMWTFTSFVQLILGSLIAIPAGAGFSILLFSLASSSNQIYPFIFSWPVLLIGFAFIFLVVVLCHTLAMISIKKWCLADNLRCRE